MTLGAGDNNARLPGSFQPQQRQGFSLIWRHGGMCPDDVTSWCQEKIRLEYGICHFNDNITILKAWISGLARLCDSRSRIIALTPSNSDKVTSNVAILRDVARKNVWSGSGICLLLIEYFLFRVPTYLFTEIRLSTSRRPPTLSLSKLPGWNITHTVTVSLKLTG